MRKAAALCALLVTALGLAASAAAAPPERIDDFELSVPDATCPGIDTFTLKGDVVSTR